MQRPSLARLHLNNGRSYCSGVPYNGGVLTVKHSVAFVGMKVVSEGEERTVVEVRRFEVGKISETNRRGDVAFLVLNAPFSEKVKQAELGKLTPVIYVTHQDDVVSPRKVAGRWKYITAGFPADYFNPRWLWLDYTNKNDRALVSGDSGGPILNSRGELIGLVSRIDFGCGPNLAHKDVQKVLP